MSRSTVAEDGGQSVHFTYRQTKLAPILASIVPAVGAERSQFMGLVGIMTEEL